jgi:ATP-dependent 26S proteasome regulatory subunit
MDSIEVPHFEKEAAFCKLVDAGMSLQMKKQSVSPTALLLSLDIALAIKEEQERTKLPNSSDLAVIQRSRERYSGHFDERSDSRVLDQVSAINDRYTRSGGQKLVVSGFKPRLDLKKMVFLNDNYCALLSLPPPSPSAMEVDVEPIEVSMKYEVPDTYTAPKVEKPVSILKTFHQPEPHAKKTTTPLHPNPIKTYLSDSKAVDEADNLVDNITLGFTTARTKYEEDQARNGKPSTLSSSSNNDKKRSITELAGGDDEDMTMTSMPPVKKRVPGMTKVTSSIVSKPSSGLYPSSSNGLHKTNGGGGGGGAAANGVKDPKGKAVAAAAVPAAKSTESEAETYKGIDPEIAERVLNEIMDKDMNVHWTDIAGLADVKETLREMIILPNKYPEMFTGLRAPPRGLLLFGPPGNGKTMIAKAIATEAGLTFFSISASVLCSKWIGEGEKTMRALFTIARAKAPSFIFIDEVDSILCSRSSEEHESSRRLKNEFLTQFDGATSNASEAVTIMGATNRPFDLDDAARRRMPKRIYVPLPEHATRFNLLSNLLKNEVHCLTPQQIEYICSKLEGYSCSDIHQLSQQAAMGPVRDKMKSQDMSGALRPINQDDFQRAIDSTRPSVAPEECKLYEDFSSKFGTKGL